MLENWDENLPRFIKIFPHEYKRVLGVKLASIAASEEVKPSLAVVGQVQHG